jgi:AraC-like DNA-binding protein
VVEHPLLVPAALAGRAHFEDHRHPVWRDLVLSAHVHRFVEVFLVVRGSAVVVLGERRMQLSAGGLMFVPPGIEHWTAETSKALRRYNLSVRPALVRRVLGADEARRVLAKGQSAVLVAQLSAAELESLAGLLSEVVRLSPDQVSRFNAGLGYALASAYVAWSKADHSAVPSTLHPAVAKALALMRGEGLHLGRNALAERTGLSVSHLSRLFVQELGQELREVRNQRRIERALELIREGHTRSLTEAAIDAGFGSYSQFHRVYTRAMGVSPSKQLAPYLERSQPGTS